MTLTLDRVATRNCPKCAFECEADSTECPRCQVVFDRVVRAEERQREFREEGDKLGGGSATERLARSEQVFIRQQVERLEAFTGFEQANRYEVLDSAGNVLFHAAEESGPWARQLLKSMRPFTLHLSTPDGLPVLTVERPFRFYFCEIKVVDQSGQPLGALVKRWSLVNRRYTLTNDTRGIEYEVFGPMLRPWTFRILRDGDECGVIRKKFNGLLREMFTDADCFGVEFPQGADIHFKSLLIGACFLIDFMHFEDNNDGD